MTPDEYLQGIMARERVDTGPSSPVRSCQAAVQQHINAWSNGHLESVTPSGSFAKGTANLSGTDIDLFISVSANTPVNLKDLYTTLFNRMQQAGYQPRMQNVSIGISVNGYKVDLVPARRQDNQSQYHSLWKNRLDTWTQTNVTQHINVVSNCGRRDEIRILKLWRNQKSLDFTSFYLELATIEALSGCRQGNLAANVQTALEYFRDRLPSARFVDPANTNNVLSEDLTQQGKRAISTAAAAARKAATWGEIVR